MAGIKRSNLKSMNNDELIEALTNLTIEIFCNNGVSKKDQLMLGAMSREMEKRGLTSDEVIAEVRKFILNN